MYNRPMRSPRPETLSPFCTELCLLQVWSSSQQLNISECLRNPPQGTPFQASSDITSLRGIPRCCVSCTHSGVKLFMGSDFILPTGSIQPMYIITDVMTTPTVGVKTQQMLKNINGWFWHIYTGAPCLDTFVASCYDNPAPLTTRASVS